MGWAGTCHPPQPWGPQLAVGPLAIEPPGLCEQLAFDAEQSRWRLLSRKEKCSDAGFRKLWTREGNRSREAWEEVTSR